MPSTEVCSECGKTISRRAKANVWEGERVVCTPCLRALETARHEAGVKARAGLDPTQRQLDFAAELGVVVPAGISRGQLSELIDEGIRRRDSMEIDVFDSEPAGRARGAAPRAGKQLGCVTMVLLAAGVALAAALAAMW